MRLVGFRGAVLLALVSILFSPAPRAAAIENESFGITPYPERVDGEDRSFFSIPLEAGAVFQDAVRIYNRTEQPLSLVIYAADAETAEDETITVSLRTDRPQGFASWFDLARSDAEIPPRGDIIVNFRVEIGSSQPLPNRGAIVAENISGGLATNAAERLHLLVHSIAPNSPTTSSRVRPLLLQSPWVILALAGLVVTVVLIVIGARRARRPRDSVVEPGGLDTDDEPAPDDLLDASRPVIKHLGEPDEADDGETEVLTSRLRRAAEHLGRKSPASKRTAQHDERPLLDDDLVVEVAAEQPSVGKRAPRTLEPLTSVEIEDVEEPSPPVRKQSPERSGQKRNEKKKPAPRKKTTSRKTTTRKPAAKRSAAKKGSPRKSAGSTIETQDFIPLKDL